MLINTTDYNTYNFSASTLIILIVIKPISIEPWCPMIQRRWQYVRWLKALSWRDAYYSVVGCYTGPGGIDCWVALTSRASRRYVWCIVSCCDVV